MAAMLPLLCAAVAAAPSAATAASAAAPSADSALPLPLANSTYLVFNSSVSPPGSRAPVTCYRIPMIEQTAAGVLVAFAEARLGAADPKTGKIVSKSCDDCVVNGIAQRRST
eukprot:SAG22_NODE_787_length_7239_cov_4.418487_4_plen_112_part_00